MNKEEARDILLDIQTFIVGIPRKQQERMCIMCGDKYPEVEVLGEKVLDLYDYLNKEFFEQSSISMRDITHPVIKTKVIKNVIK